MADISLYLSQIEEAVYGEEVRGSIINAISAINNENASLQTQTESTVQNFLNNFKVYSHVDELPEVGDPQLIYAIADINYIDSDINTSADTAGSIGRTKWTEDNDKSPNDTAYITFSSSYDTDETASKPVMKRYYLRSKQIAYGPAGAGGYTYTPSLIYLNKENLEYIAMSSVGRAIISEQFNAWSIKYIDFEVLNQTSTTLTGCSVTLEFDEFIYDSNSTSRGWKYNKTVTYTKGNLTAKQYDRSLYRITLSTIVNDISNILFTEMPINDDGTPKVKKLPSPEYFPAYKNAHYYFSCNGANKEILPAYWDTWFNQLFANGISRDLYGYDCKNHSTYLVISSKGSHMFSGFAFIDYTIPTTNIWDVIGDTGNTAAMYIWNQTLSKYIRLVCKIEQEVPSTNGTYTLQCTVNNGEVTYNWVSVT